LNGWFWLTLLCRRECFVGLSGLNNYSCKRNFTGGSARGYISLFAKLAVVASVFAGGTRIRHRLPPARTLGSFAAQMRRTASQIAHKSYITPRRAVPWCGKRIKPQGFSLCIACYIGEGRFFLKRLAEQCVTFERLGRQGFSAAIAAKKSRHSPAKTDATAASRSEKKYLPALNSIGEKKKRAQPAITISKDVRYINDLCLCVNKFIRLLAQL
jgi:hypothetical protein